MREQPDAIEMRGGQEWARYGRLWFYVDRRPRGGLTPEAYAYVEECNAESDAEAAFIASHTREEVAERMAAARGNRRWRRWWEPEPSSPGRWNPPYPVRHAVAERYGAREGQTVPVACPRCGASGAIHWKRQRVRFVGMHMDHIKPRSRGGPDTAENLQLLCPSCNYQKSNRLES